MNTGKLIGSSLTLLVVLVVAAILLTSCGYVWSNVAPNEIGIQLRSSQIINVVPPGRYSDWPGLFRDIVRVNVEGLRFCSEDPEVLTKDQQRIGLKVCGTVHRPGLEKADVYRTLWATYRTIYSSDEALVGTIDEAGNPVAGGLMNDLGQQAMKVCVGDRTFEEAAVGSARDVLRTCIDTELTKLVDPYGLDVKNVVVPNIVLNPTVQALLDAITDAKFQTDLARQNALKESAQAEERLAKEQGQIRVDQGKIQETERQKAITAELEKKALEAQLQVIVAQKANELKAAELAKRVSSAELEVAKLEAQKQIAKEFALAGLYNDNPSYLALLIAQTWAAAWNEVDKVIIPAGVDPATVLSPEGTGVTAVFPVPPSEENK